MAGYPEFTRAVLALRCGAWELVANDWRVALNALQIIAEQGPGLAIWEQEKSETARVGRLPRLVH